MRSAVVLALAVVLTACSGGQTFSGSSQEGGTVTSTTSGTPLTTQASVPSQDEQASASSEAAQGGGGAGYDLTGSWQGELTQVGATGVCGSMPAQLGEVIIDQARSSFTMAFGEGFQCNPAQACEFEGTNEGGEYQATNGGPADSEGGVYLSSFVFTVQDADHANGLGESSYTLEGMTCTWQTALVLVRTTG
jgi:hypothetical protein